MSEINQLITELLASQVKNISNFKSEILTALHVLLNGHFLKYDIENSISSQDGVNLSDISFQNILSRINERTKKRKNNGVYYTPHDVAKYIICNSFINNMFAHNQRTYNLEEGLETLNSLSREKTNVLLYNKTIIDPTCGAGEFLVNAFDLKYLLATIKNRISDKKILDICSTIFGNDIDDESIDITKIRLFFCVASKLKNKKSFVELATILNKQFHSIDFVGNSQKIVDRFDIIIGNPPYIEYGKYNDKKNLHNCFGNVYADVIKNSIDILNENGVLGYVIPLSYTSTARMTEIRNYVIETTSKQFILNFADRPDCLFTGVHQKLNILIAKKGRAPHLMYTSSYKHWYKDERGKLLNGREVWLCTHTSPQFIPKIGNALEESIFRKIHTYTPSNIFDLQSLNGKQLYLNMRACFWIKAFSFNPGSKEYKNFIYSEKYYGFILCLLNSSLFWLYWTIMSDCWHITIKELKGFFVPNNLQSNVDFNILSKKLEMKLEKTKKYIKTKQVDYEYKHKLCKDVIDEIDDALAKVYGLNSEELNYVKLFAIKYRSGGGNDD